MKARHLMVLLLVAGSACSVAIDGEREERDRAAAAGARWQSPFADRPTLVPAADAGLADWIAAAEQHNGTLEAAFHRWCAAIEDVPQAATQDTTAMLGVQHRFDGGKALDRSALELVSDAMNNWLWPGRLEARGAAALAAARTAGAEFVQARLRLQREVAERFHALALHREEIAVQQRLHDVLALAVPSLRARVSAGMASQPELLQAMAMHQRAATELARLQGEHATFVVALRTIAGVAHGPTVPAPAVEPLLPLRTEEETAIARALAANPELTVRSREHEAALAAATAQEWARVPEFAFTSMLTGDGAVEVGAALTLPFLRGHALDAATRQQEALVRAATALRLQAERDATGAALTELALLRAAAAEHGLLAREQATAASLSALARAAWSAGTAPFQDWSAAEVLRLDIELRQLRVRSAAAVARARLQEALGELEAAAPGAESGH